MNEELKQILGRAAASSRNAQADQTDPKSRKAKSKSGSGKKKSGKSPGLFGRMADLYERMEKAYNASAAAAGLTCKDCPTNCCTSYFKHHTYIEWAYLWRGLSSLPDKERNLLVAKAKEYIQEANQALAAGALPRAMCPLNEQGLCILYPYRLMICRMHGTRNVFSSPDGTQQEFPGCARFTAMHGSAPEQKSGPEAGAESGPEASAEPGPEAGAESGPEAGAESGPEAGAESGPEAGAESGHTACQPSGSENPAADCSTSGKASPCALDRTPFYTELAALEGEFRLRSVQPLFRVDMTLAEMIVAGPPRFQ